MSQQVESQAPPGEETEEEEEAVHVVDLAFGAGYKEVLKEQFFSPDISSLIVLGLKLDPGVIFPYYNGKAATTDMIIKAATSEESAPSRSTRQTSSTSSRMLAHSRAAVVPSSSATS